MISRLRRAALGGVFVGVLALGSNFALAQGDAPPAADHKGPGGDEKITASTELRKSLVKVFTTSREPDLARPWTKRQPQEASGSGVVIEGKRILTNNHVVAYANRILVQADGTSDKLPAKVIAAAPGIDLAVIELEDPSFFDTHPSLPMSDDLPEIGNTVIAYGYPLGGDALSVTKGIVSRIEYTEFNEGTMGLRIQVDAALNHGNSGGPACVNDKIVGLVFSGIDTAQNIGYLIPVEEIKAFLEDIKDGKYEGRPQFYASMQTLENDALRARLKADKGVTGMVVTRVRHEKADDPLKPWDIITAVGSHKIDNDGMTQLKPNVRVGFGYWVPHEAKDGKVPLTVYREGKMLDVQAPAKAERDMLFKPLNGTYPSYFILGPLTFTPVMREHAGLNAQFLARRNSPILARMDDPPAFEGEQMVAGPYKMHTHKIGKGYEVQFFPILKKFNGESVKNLKDLVAKVKASKDEYLIFEWADDDAETLVFKREELLKSTDEILDDNGIRAQMSDDVKGVWDGK